MKMIIWLLITKETSIPFDEVLEILLDYKLNFSPHIKNLCEASTNQLNALIRLQKVFMFQRKLNFDK